MSLEQRAVNEQGMLAVCELGVTDYQVAWDLQRELADARRFDLIPDVLLLLEHPHTYTLGRRGRLENVLLTNAELSDRGIALYNVDRGGDVTYHGPGQLVGYPILKLPYERLDYVGYVRDMERALLRAIRDLDVSAELKQGFSGVWLGNDKICAIGVKVDAAGVTSHGFALNVNPDLSYFEQIIPCGLTDKGVTSLDLLLGQRVPMDVVQDRVIAHMAEEFDLIPARVSNRTLEEMLGRAA